MARPMSAMPGPSSAATTSIPCLPLFCTNLNMISPRTASRTIFRASSEIAVATTAVSVDGKPHCDASSRPFCRAETTSESQSMETRTSSAMSPDLLTVPIALTVEVGEAFLQVQRGRNTFQGEPELDHREGDLRLDADDHGLGAAQADHVGHVPQGAGRKRIDHVERGDVDDDSTRPDLADLEHQGVAQLLEVLVGQRRLHRSDQRGALLEDRNLHALAPLGGVRHGLLHQDDLVAEQPLGLLDATLEIADRVHLPQ